MSLRKYSLFTLILFLALSFITYSIEKTEVFNIDNEWTINFPKNWEMEKNERYEQYYAISPSIPYYSTIRIYNYDVQENQNINLLGILKKKYPNSKIKEKKLDFNKIKIKNVKVETYEYSFDENGGKLYAISSLISLDKKVLIVHFYSISKEEVERMLEYIYSIEKIK